MIFEIGMIMSDKRPIFLNVLKIHLPITGLVSIMHRISGVALILFLPLFLWGLSQITGTPEDYHDFLELLRSPVIVGLYWLGIVAFIYHLLAGIRHLIMDIGFLENLKSARISASVLLIVFIVLAILVGVRLC